MWLQGLSTKDELCDSFSLSRCVENIMQATDLMLLWPVKAEPSKIKQSRFPSGFAHGETTRSSGEIQIKVLHIRQSNISGEVSSLAPAFEDGADSFAFHLTNPKKKTNQKTKPT